jgi:hypothetical protein
LKFKTGFGPTSSAVGIFEPVTITRSAVGTPFSFTFVVVGGAGTAVVLAAGIPGALVAGAPGAGPPGRATASCACTLAEAKIKSPAARAKAMLKILEVRRARFFIGWLGSPNGLTSREKRDKPFRKKRFSYEKNSLTHSPNDPRPVAAKSA